MTNISKYWELRELSDKALLERYFANDEYDPDDCGEIVRRTGHKEKWDELTADDYDEAINLLDECISELEEGLE